MRADSFSGAFGAVRYYFSRVTHECSFQKC